jgi:hypothetical protein
LRLCDVRFWHKADITVVSADVRFWENSGHYADGAIARSDRAQLIEGEVIEVED